MKAKDEEIKKKKEEKEDDLLDLDNVLSVGIGTKKRNEKDTGESAIVVGVREKIDEEKLDPNQIVPKDVDGKETDVIEIGEPQAPPKMKTGIVEKLKESVKSINPFSDKSHKARFRPVPLGVSIGHFMITAGTSGFILVDDEGNEFPCSNNHVLARSNKASPGDPILQPGPHDGGKKEEDKIGSLEDYIPVKDGAKVDLAWLSPNKTKFDNDVYKIQKDIGNSKKAEVGDSVIKSGRTTGVTEGKVMQRNASVNVKYPDKKVKLKDQMICSSFSSGGDSGSAVFKEIDGVLHPIGILFAGSDKVTILNEIGNVVKISGMSIKSDKGGGGNGDNGTGKDHDSLIKLILKFLEEFFKLKEDK